MLLYPHEITRIVSVIRRRYRRAAVHILVFVIHRRRNPDRRHAHALDIRHLLLDPGEIAAPVGQPVRLRGIEQPPALRWIVVRRIAVEEPVGHDLVDDLLLEILCVSQAETRKERYRKHYESESARNHGTPLGQIGQAPLAGIGIQLRYYHISSMLGTTT